MGRQYEVWIKNREKDPYILLAAAIVRQVMLDLKYAIEFGDKGEEYALKNWLLSAYGQLLSGDQGEYIISEVYKTCAKG